MPASRLPERAAAGERSVAAWVSAAKARLREPRRRRKLAKPGIKDTRRPATISRPGASQHMGKPRPVDAGHCRLFRAFGRLATGPQ